MVKTEAPTIKTQPKSVTVKSGKKAKFSVKASGKNLKYQWYERANADAEWTAVNGGTKNSLSVETSKAKNGCQYYCKVTNPDGTVNSAVATLTVTPEAPVIKTQPKDVKVKAGAKAKFSVKASGKNISYQWYERFDAKSEWKLMKQAGRRHQGGVLLRGFGRDVRLAVPLPGQERRRRSLVQGRHPTAEMI